MISQRNFIKIICKMLKMFQKQQN